MMKEIIKKKRKQPEKVIEEMVMQVYNNSEVINADEIDSKEFKSYHWASVPYSTIRRTIRLLAWMIS